MKKLAFILLSLSFASSAIFAESTKIGYINIDNVVSTSPQFIEANQMALEEFKPQEEKLLALRKALEVELEAFGKKRDSLSKEEIQAEFKRISALERNLKQKVVALQDELKLKNVEELQKIEDLINQIIKEVAKEQAFDLILYQEAAYVNEKINITSLISEKLRALFK